MREIADLRLQIADLFQIADPRLTTWPLALPC
jgi:hypothetical protein